jgi:hypothetical protein
MAAPRTVSATLLALAASMAGGCATYPPPAVESPAVQAPVPAPIGVPELLEMLRAGRSEVELIAEVNARGVQAPPAPADIDVLLQAGAGPELILALQNARVGGVPSDVTLGEPVAPATAPAVGPWWGWYPLTWGFSFGYWSNPWWGYPARPYPPPLYPGRPYPPSVYPGRPYPPSAWPGRPIPPAHPVRPPPPPPGGIVPGPRPPGGFAPGPRPPGGGATLPPPAGMRPGPTPNLGKPIPQPRVLPGKRSQ